MKRLASFLSLLWALFAVASIAVAVSQPTSVSVMDSHQTTVHQSGVYAPQQSRRLRQLATPDPLTNPRISRRPLSAKAEYTKPRQSSTPGRAESSGLPRVWAWRHVTLIPHVITCPSILAALIPILSRRDLASMQMDLMAIEDGTDLPMGWHRMASVPIFDGDGEQSGTTYLPTHRHGETWQELPQRLMDRYDSPTKVLPADQEEMAMRQKLTRALVMDPQEWWRLAKVNLVHAATAAANEFAAHYMPKDFQPIYRQYLQRVDAKIESGLQEEVMRELDRCITGEPLLPVVQNMIEAMHETLPSSFSASDRLAAYQLQRIHQRVMHKLSNGGDAVMIDYYAANIGASIERRIRNVVIGAVDKLPERARDEMMDEIRNLFPAIQVRFRYTLWRNMIRNDDDGYDPKDDDDALMLSSDADIQDIVTDLDVPFDLNGLVKMPAMFLVCVMTGMASAWSLLAANIVRIFFQIPWVRDQLLVLLELMLIDGYDTAFGIRLKPLLRRDSIDD